MNTKFLFKTIYPDNEIELSICTLPDYVQEFNRLNKIHNNKIKFKIVTNKKLLEIVDLNINDCFQVNELTKEEISSIPF
tara:strand:- start:82 stop:318 length:237 start_codon:yes stop_codon:yes gene_type:complete